MSFIRRIGPLAGVAALSAALLVACGGGGADTTPRVQVSSVKVVGDSLADVGTFGFRATIQGNDMYPEYVSQNYGLGKGCNFFAFNGTTFVPNSKTGCTNYAVAGGVINPASGNLSAADPRGIPVQLAAAVAAGNYGAGDLLLIDGGGNDAAALVTAYLRAATDRGASYVALISTMLTQAQVGAAVGGGQAGLATAGGQYMTALADRFYDLTKTQALDKGVQRVAMLNIPDITKTPRFQAVLDGIALFAGGGAAGAAARTQSEALFNGWVVAFNTQLAKRVGSDARVALIDLYTTFADEVNNPAQYALTNVKTPACPAVGVSADGLPTYNFPTCTDALLAANPPAGQSGSAWYKRYLFSDGFHPTPYGHQLAAQLIARSLALSGWL